MIDKCMFWLFSTNSLRFTTWKSQQWSKKHSSKNLDLHAELRPWCSRLEGTGYLDMEFLASSKDHDSMDDKERCKNETTWCCVIGTYRNILRPRFKSSLWIQWSCWQSMFTLHMLPFPCSDVLLADFIGMCQWYHLSYSEFLDESLHAMGASNIINATESGWFLC